MTTYQIIHADCTASLPEIRSSVDLTFLDPPFNQAKDYAYHDDNLPDEDYWDWMESICRKVFDLTSQGGAIYFMQREKNTEQVLRCLRLADWTFQNLIIWKKKTSAVPGNFRFGKHYQIIAFATKGDRPRVFNRLRIDPPLLETEKIRRPNGMYVTDIWDDIRELTSGYFAGDEPLRDGQGERLHKQQSPVALLLRIILSSTLVGDTVLDPFAGTGTTLVVARQLKRHSIGIEIDPNNIAFIEDRLQNPRQSDRIQKYHHDYRYTENLRDIWQEDTEIVSESHVFNLPLRTFA
jgi:DNA modification methylase